MRTLFISSVVPWPMDAGNRIRAHHLLRAVSRVSEVTLVSFANSSDDARQLEGVRPFVRESFAVSRESCRYRRLTRLPRPIQLSRSFLDYCHPTKPALLLALQSSELTRLMERLSREPFDLVWGERLGTLQCLPYFPNSRHIIDLDDLEHRKLEYMLRVSTLNRLTLLQYLELLKLRRFERTLPRMPVEVVVCSAHDKSLLGDSSGIWVVPNGVDIAAAGATHVSSSIDQALVFIGTMNYGPNIDAVLFFAEQVLPLIRRHLPQVRLLLVGRDPTPEVRALHDGQTVLVTGAVPSVRPYLEGGGVVVAPIRFGGGTRIKILEAMAYRRPVISTSVGAEGIAAVPGRDLIISDDAQGFADACVRVLTDAHLQELLGSSGYKLVRANYDWRAIESQVEMIATCHTPRQRRLQS